MNPTNKKGKKGRISTIILSAILGRNAVITRTMTNFNRHLRSTNPRKTDTDNRRRLAGNLNDKQCIARGLADILKCQ